MQLEKYSIGVGDRFGRQGEAQLQALADARAVGIEIVPVWNKSNREHQIVGTTQDSVRDEAERAVKALGWKASYYVDADHISMANVDSFIAASDFFTIDVADAIGTPPQAADLENFVREYSGFCGQLCLPGIEGRLNVTEDDIRRIGRTYLCAIEEAGRTYRHIRDKKGGDRFVTEVSMDETVNPQTPVDLLFILAGLAAEGVPVQTIAPKFSGRFNKGVDYVGDTEEFASEFEQDLGAIRTAVREFDLPQNLKLSVHSGSDKFALYPLIARHLLKFDAGVHLKTAGTTWLEEIIGLAESEGAGLEVARKIYAAALERFEEMCKPYAEVIDIDRDNLPPPAAVAAWDGETFAAALRHEQGCPEFNPDFRQLLHVAYKVAAEMGDGYLAALDENRESVARNVTANLLKRHIKPLFGNAAPPS